MDFSFDARTEELRRKLLHFMDEHVYPAEPVARAQRAEQESPWQTPEVVEELKTTARRQGLWNLFLPDRTYGAGLTHLQYAPLAEITGRSPELAPVALNCSAPDSGNMDLLAEFGDAEQRRRWLEPLLSGELRSGFAGAEPEMASSDASNVETSIRRDGGAYLVDGRKWYVTGALHPDCRLLVVLGRTDAETEDVRRRQSLVLVPRDTPGVEVRRAMTVYGYDGRAHGGHAEVVFDEVRVPAENLIGQVGDGFSITQARLCPSRVHHCMRLVGMAERAIELMCRRAAGREAFGAPLSEQGVVREWIAEARVRVEQLRLLVLKTAWLMDTVDGRESQTELPENHAIKIATPRTVADILDRAVQLHGAAGVSQDSPLAGLWAAARALRLADGPDEVHRRSLARHELAGYA